MTAGLPQRSKRFGVGKEIGGAVYVHRDYEDRLGDAVREAKKHLPESASYHVVKLNQRTGAVSFIQCVDFDTAPEPTVGDIVTIDVEGNSRHRSQPRDPEIYHHKWLFVADDYAGFNVPQSKQRSLAWSALEGVDRKRIGRKSYWEQIVVPRLMAIGGSPHEHS
jgi:hypothetical protein